MADNNEPIHIEDDDARAASTNGKLRWILGIGLFLAIVLMTVVWVVPALWG